MKIIVTNFNRITNHLKRIFFGPTLRFIFLQLGLTSKYRFLNTNATAIGHLCIDIDSFLKEREYEKFPFCGILLAPRSVVANRALAKLWGQHPGLVVIENTLICFLLDYLRIYWDTSFDCSKYCAIDGQQAEVYSVRSKYARIDPTITWEKDLYAEAISIFKRVFIGVDVKRVVALHSRDSKYDSITGNSNYLNQNYRNSELQSFKAIMEYLNTRGYVLIRLGQYEISEGMNENKYLELIGVNKFERDLLNLYISSECAAFLGSASGASDLATIWNKPVFRINVLPYSFLRPHSEKGMAIPKLLKKNGVILSAHQIFQEDYHWLRDDAAYKSNNIQIENNDPQDCLLDFVEFFKSFVDQDKHMLEEIVHSHQQKTYKLICPEDSYDYRAQSLVPRNFFRKYAIV
jgi:putative glycosyltransferase (TIGR04372 family)